MTTLALAEAVAVIVLSLAFASIVRSLIRQHARERQLLINQMLHLAGKPWLEAPADHAEQPEMEPVPTPRRYSATPEQYPTY